MYIIYLIHYPMNQETQLMHGKLFITMVIMSHGKDAGPGITEMMDLILQGKGR